MRTARLVLVLALAAPLLLAACEGPVGPPGPEGPPGAANVFSETFEFNQRDFVLNEAGDVAGVQYDVDGLTEAFTEDGLVMMYFLDDFGTWTPMPFTYAFENPDLPAVDYTITLAYAFDVEFLEVFYQASSGNILVENEPGRTVRLVAVEGYGGFAKDALPFDPHDYVSVADYFGLEK